MSEALIGLTIQLHSDLKMLHVEHQVMRELLIDAVVLMARDAPDHLKELWLKKVNRALYYGDHPSSPPS